jgi:hypothetical protein
MKEKLQQAPYNILPPLPRGSTFSKVEFSYGNETFEIIAETQRALKLAEMNPDATVTYMGLGYD